MTAIIMDGKQEALNVRKILDTTHDAGWSREWFGKGRA